ncbi:MAG: hypothetical protein KJ720_08500 [Proteobacteria bacterium]|nr:hypothetical protein [Pseudomonadota bacterium]MBU1451832.1 hypothetical protein [Pseudomonadota bacterium]
MARRKRIYVKVKGGGVVDLGELMKARRPKVGAVTDLFYSYPDADQCQDLARLAKSLEEDAKNFLKISPLPEDLNMLEGEATKRANEISRYAAEAIELGIEDKRKEILGVWLREQDFPDTPYDLLRLEIPLEARKNENGKLQYQAKIGFRYKAAAETIKAAQKLLVCLKTDDMHNAPYWAATMLLNACRYGLGSELLVGYKWRRGQSKGGSKGSKTRQALTNQWHESIRDHANKLLQQGKSPRELAGILGKIYNYTPQHIRRILQK